MLKFIIIGCPRTGTSLLGRVLVNSGIDLGAPYRMADPARNPLGFYESLAAGAASRALAWRSGQAAYYSFWLLASRGWNSNQPWPVENLDTMRPEGLPEYKRFLKMAEAAGVKDGFTVLVWPLVAQVLPEKTWLVVTERDREDTVASLRRDGAYQTLAHIHYAGEFYDWFHVALNEISEQRPNRILRVRFDDFFTEPGRARIAEVLAPILDGSALNFSSVVSDSPLTGKRNWTPDTTCTGLPA